MVSSPIKTKDSICEELSNLSKPKSLKTTSPGLFLPNTPLFGTDGIRGKVGRILNAELALQIGVWAGHVLGASASHSGPIIVGQDSRNSSDMLAMAITAGLTSVGLEVWHLGLCPTPCVSHLTRVTNAVGGVMISASHNPPEDNGIKFFGSNGIKLEPAYTQQIEAGLRGQLNPPLSSGQRWGKYYDRSTLTQTYEEALVGSLPPNLTFQGMRVVLDLAWGASVHLAPEIFKALGAEVICLHDQPDGDRINVDCGSTHLAKLQRVIQDYQADLGFAFDGDADRVMAVDSQGRVVDGDYILYFWGKELKDKKQLPDNLIIGTVMANLGFERAWQKLGGQLTRTSVGDQHVQAEMLKTGAPLGGEQSGHILCHHHSFSGDGLQTALHLTALVQESGLSLGEFVNQSFQPYPQLLRNVRVEDRDRRCQWQNCQPLQNAITQAETAMGDQGRILVRASGTEPVIRVMVEAADAQMVNHWTERLVKSVQQHVA